MALEEMVGIVVSTIFQNKIDNCENVATIEVLVLKNSMHS